MKLHLIKLPCALVMAVILSACGGEANDGEESGKTVRYSGKVTDEGGTPLSGIQVTLENRVTDVSVRVITGAEGNFSTDVQAGAYDILFDDLDAEKYTSLQKTAIDLQVDQEDTIEIGLTKGASRNLITGVVTTADGWPVPNRQIWVVPFSAKSTSVVETGASESVPALSNWATLNPKPLRTDAQGKFRVLLEEEAEEKIDIDFDLIVLSPDAEQFDLSQIQTGHSFLTQEDQDAYYGEVRRYLEANATEILDIEKSPGLMHLQVRLGSKEQNLLNSIGLPSITTEAKRRAIEIKASKNGDYSFKTALSNFTQHSIASFLNIIPSAQAWEVSRLFALHGSKREKTQANPGVYALLHTGLLVNKSSGSQFKFKDIRSRAYAHNLGSEDEYKYWPDVLRMLETDGFEIKANPSKENGYTLILNQDKPSNCKFTFGAYGVSINSQTGAIYHAKVESPSTDFAVNPSNSSLRLIECQIPLRE